MSNNGNSKDKPAIVSWVKVSARSDGSIKVETPDMNMENHRNIAAVIDLLSGGISAICHTRLYRMGEQSRIIPAAVVPKIVRK